MLSLLPRLTRRRQLVVLRYFGLFGRRPHTFAELAERMQVSSGRIGQLLRRALRELRLWSAQADTAEHLLAGPNAEMIAEAADRRATEIAAAEAARARHLDAVFADAERLWCEASKRIDSRSSHDHEVARALLDDLRSAADRHGARAAFELRLGELRASTAKYRQFWARWAARSTQRSKPVPQP